MITFTIPGQPVGKGRPRFRMAGGHVQTYTPDKTGDYERAVRLAYEATKQGMLEGPLYVRLRMYFAIPASKSKAVKAQMRSGNLRPQIKPDIDNCVKAILDGLNGAAYRDDKQVVDIRAGKWYDENPRVEVEIFTADKDDRLEMRRA